MSQENAVRKPLSGAHNTSRTFEERLMLRFPGLFRVIGRVTLRRPVTSRLRQRLISRSISQGLAAVNRRDFDAVLPKYNPAVEIRTPPTFHALGDIQPVYRGREGYLQLYRDWLPAWGDSFHFEPREVIDLGTNQLVALVEVNFRGQGSGIGFEQKMAFVWTLDNEARSVLEQLFLDWGEALEAVGLSEHDAHAES
jgi:ketosteroid isomerase-like protein